MRLLTRSRLNRKPEICKSQSSGDTTRKYKALFSKVDSGALAGGKDDDGW